MTQNGFALLAGYESDNDSIATTVPDSLSTLADTQLIDDIPDTVPESVPDAQVIPATVPDLASDLFPFRDGAGNRFSQFSVFVPASAVPKATRGWSWEEINAAIRRCGMLGMWKQGGQHDRVIYESESTEKRFIINFQRGSVWVQGRDAMSVDVQLKAARGA